MAECLSLPGYSLLDIAAGTGVAVGPRVVVALPLRNGLNTGGASLTGRYARHAPAPVRRRIARLRAAF